MSKSKFDTEHTFVPVCPYCGAIQRDAWEIPFAGDEGIEMDCDRCGKPIWIERYVSVEYSTYRVVRTPKHDPNTLTRGLPKGAI